MEDNHIQMLRSLGIKDIDEKNARDRFYWIERGNSYQAIATQKREVYNVIDYTRENMTLTR